MHKSPCFQFYPQDFLADANVAIMNAEEVGVYWLLINYCWVEGSIPAEFSELALLGRVTEDWFTERRAIKVLRCFTPREDGRLVHKRLLKEKRKQEDWRRKSVAGGIRSGQVRREKTAQKINENFSTFRSEGSTIPTASGGSPNESDNKPSKGGSRVVEPKGNSSSSSSSSEEDVRGLVVFSSEPLSSSSSAGRSVDNTDSPRKKHTSSEAARPVRLREVDEVFTYWQAKMKHPNAKLTAKRKRKVVTRLNEGYSTSQLKSAIDGCEQSPFHQGDNPSGTIFDDLELICRDGEHVEQFININHQETHNVRRPETKHDKRIREFHDRIRELHQGDADPADDGSSAIALLPGSSSTRDQ
jgi:uncharacterized protein YdaU (DUF1376 family)